MESAKAYESPGLLRSYCRDHIRIMGASLTLFAVAGFAVWLYNLPLGAVLYTAAITFVIVFLLFILPDFLRYRKKRLLLLELRDNIQSTLSFPEAGDSCLRCFSFPEAELAGLSRDLCDKLRELSSLQSIRQTEMLDYYTMWVHQIKTPLSAMRLILQSEPTEAGQALTQELFKVERYVEMVLGFLRLETMSSDLRLERCAICDVVKKAVRKYAPLFIYQKLSLHLEEFDTQAVTDKKWLQFTIEQLLSNALKYTKTGSVSISMDKDGVLAITDTGIGISPDDLPRIFERGFTGYNGRMAETSSGLGLYLVKRILQKLRHPITITSVTDKGTTVKIDLHREDFTAY